MFFRKKQIFFSLVIYCAAAGKNTQDIDCTEVLYVNKCKNRSCERSAAHRTGQGVEAHEETLHGFGVTAVEILDDIGAQQLNKPVGKYFTLELPSFMDRGGENFAGAAEAVSELLRRCLPNSVGSAFIAALGNPDITPDALGNLAAAYTLVTRHLMPLPGFESFCSTALCRTGVLGTTGIESAALVRGVVSLVRPDRVIAVDALSAREAARLCRAVQVTDAGIVPGSGVGNNREMLSAENLGVPVIAVGVPTVIDASAFSDCDELRGMFVTPRGIDSLVRCAGRLIGYGIDLALHPGPSAEDIAMLVR